jgi:hypothetical protein
MHLTNLQWRILIFPQCFPLYQQQSLHPTQLRHVDKSVLYTFSPLPSTSTQLLCDVRSFGEDHSLLSTLSGIGGKKRGNACDVGRNVTAVSPFVRSLQSNKRKTSTKKLLTLGNVHLEKSWRKEEEGQ